MMAECISTASDMSPVKCTETKETNTSDINSCLATDSVNETSAINLNDPDLDLHALFLKFFEDGSDSECIKTLPGVSHIIFFAKTNTANFFTFDCVVCNPLAGKILSGKGLINHLRNRNHLLNILKLHDYTLFERYKDISTEISTDLLNKISMYESKSEKYIHIVTAKTYREERRKVATIVTEMREVCEMNNEMQTSRTCKSDSNDEARIEVLEQNKPFSEEIKTAVDDVDSSNVLPSDDSLKQHLEKPISPAIYYLHTSIRTLATKLAKEQQDRQPKKLVFIIDKEEIQFETEQFGELAKFVKIVNLNFSNAIESLKHQDLIGRGYLFIISCGLYTLITGTSPEICCKMNCSMPLKTYTMDPKLSFKDLALHALKLQEYVLNNSTDDQVMFCDIIPINISSSVLRTCENKHSLRQTTRPEIYTKYLNTINEYNKFVDVHCQIFGFKNLNLLNIFFPSKAYNITHPVDFMYDFREVDDEHVFNSINDSIYNLLTKMDVNMDEMPEVFVFKSVTKSKLSGISALKLFEKIVIVTTRQYAPYFELLKCEQVKLTFARSYEIDAIAEAIKIRKNLEPKRTLWLTHMEMFQTSRFERTKMCSSCAEPLEIFIPPNQSSMTLSDYVTNIQHGFSALAKNVSSFLDAESSFAILPPFPPTILVLENCNHQLYHNMYMEQKMFYLVTKGSMNQFELFTELSKQLITLSLAEFVKANITSHSLVDYSDLAISWNSYVDIPISENNIDGVSNAKYILWLEYSNKLISENLEFKIDEGEVGPAISAQHTAITSSENKTSIALPINVQNPIGVVSSVPEFTNSSNNNYDHIVFIYFSEEHSLIIPEEKDNANNISSVMLNSDQKWDTSKFNRFQSRGFKNILFIVMGSIKLLGRTMLESYCLKDKCIKPISYLQLVSVDAVENTKQKLKLFLRDLARIFRTNSTVLFTPFICLKCAKKSYISNEQDHNFVHQSCLNVSDLYLLGGTVQTWVECCRKLTNYWDNEMYIMLHRVFPIEKNHFRNVIKTFKNISVSPINLVNFPYNSSVNYEQRYKTSLKIFLRMVCPYISLKNVQNLSTPQVHSVPSNTGISHSYNLRSNIAKTQPAVPYSKQINSGQSSTSTVEMKGPETTSTHPQSSNGHIGSSASSTADSGPYSAPFWQDCVTYGSESSVHYLTDAIRRLQNQWQPGQRLKVLYIGSSVEIVNDMQSRLNALNSITLRRSYSVVLNEASIVADKYDCLLTTLFVLTNYHWDIVCRKDIRALIVDDVMKVLKNVEDRIALTSVFRRMNLKENTGISKVFVAKVYESNLPEYLTSVFGIPLIEVKTSDCDTSSSSGTWVSQGKEQSNQIVGYPMSSDQVATEHLTTDYAAGTCYSGSSQTAEYPVASREYNRDNYSTDGGYLTGHYGTENTPSLLATDGGSYLQPSQESRNLNKTTHRSRSRDRQPSYASEYSPRRRRRSYSMTRRKSSHSMARKETRHRSRDRSHSGGRHRSRNRSHSGRRRYLSSSRHKRRKRSKSINKNSRKKRRRSNSPSKLQNKSRASSRSKVHHSKLPLAHTSRRSYSRSSSIDTICSDNTTDHPDSSLASFSISGALELLGNMSDKLGILGPVLKSLITSVNLDLKTNRTKALNTLREEDNIVFFKMTVDKLKKLLQSASLSEIYLVSKTIDWTTRLISYAEKIPKQEVNINLKAIAAASISKPPEFTISLIKSTLAYESNETPTKEEVNEIFLKVCSIQCEIMMGS